MDAPLVNALTVLTDNAAGEPPSAVRAAALDAAITHLAGSGSRYQDTSQDGSGVIEVARAFEAYLAAPEVVGLNEPERTGLADLLDRTRQMLINICTGTVEGIPGGFAAMAVDAVDSDLTGRLHRYAQLLRGEVTG